MYKCKQCSFKTSSLSEINWHVANRHSSNAINYSSSYFSNSNSSSLSNNNSFSSDGGLFDGGGSSSDY